MFILNTGGIKVADGYVEREGKNIESKEVEERRDEVRLRRTETNPICSSRNLSSAFSPFGIQPPVFKACL